MKILRKITILSCSMMIAFSTVAFAATTLLTYNGTNIRGKYSVNSFSLGSASSITINHTNSAWNGAGSSQQDMNVEVHRKGLFGYSHYNNKTSTFSGVGSGSDSQWLNDSGTYKLYFHVPNGAGSADINGSVTN